MLWISLDPGSTCCLHEDEELLIGGASGVVGKLTGVGGALPERGRENPAEKKKKVESQSSLH